MTRGVKHWRSTIAWIAGASLIAFILYVAWVKPTDGPFFISDMAVLDAATHTQYEIDLDEIHRFWPVQILPPSHFRSEHGIAMYSWLAEEHKARSAVTVALWFIIVAYAGWKQVRSNYAEGNR
jgi:hypothetical protein